MAAPKKRGPSQDLSEKQRAFVKAYLGEADADATKAARMAGYNGTTAKSFQAIGNELLRKPWVVAEILRIRDERATVHALTRREREKLLTDIALNPMAKFSSRVRALEVLGKMNGDFVERRIVEGKVEMSFAAQREQLRALLLDENVVQAADVIATAAEGVEA